MLFFLGGIIFWCLAILAFREYRRLKFKNDLFLALFFLSIGWLFPIVLIFPYSAPDPPTLFIGVGANLLISIAIVFMNLFVDYTVGEETSLTTQITMLFTGFIDGLLIAQGGFTMTQKESLYGKMYLIDFPSDFSQIAFILMFVICITAIIRLFWYAAMIHKETQKSPSNKASAQILFFMATGALLWVTFTILKRFYPYYLVGLDFLFISLFYLITLTFYLKKRELLYFLPGTLDLLIVIHRNGLHLFDYNFKTKQISLKSHSKESYQQNNLRNLLHAITLSLQEVVSKEVSATDLNNITFSGSEVLRKQTDSLVWFLLSHDSPSKKYQLLFNKFVKEIEEECQKELEEFKSGIVYVSEKFSNLVQAKFSKIS